MFVFSNRPYCKIFHLTNRGRRHQQLVWSMDGFSPIAKAKKEMQSYNPLDMKYRVSIPSHRSLEKNYEYFLIYQFVLGA